MLVGDIRSNHIKNHELLLPFVVLLLLSAQMRRHNKAGRAYDPAHKPATLLIVFLPDGLFLCHLWETQSFRIVLGWSLHLCLRPCP